MFRMLTDQGPGQVASMIVLVEQLTTLAMMGALVFTTLPLATWLTCSSLLAVISCIARLNSYTVPRALAEPVLALHTLEGLVLFFILIMWRLHANQRSMSDILLCIIVFTCVLGGDMLVVGLAKVRSGDSVIISQDLGFPWKEKGVTVPMPEIDRFRFQTDAEEAHGDVPIGRSRIQDTCAVCLQDFQVGEEIGRLGCQHTFHIPCLERWMKTRTAPPWCPFRCSPVAEPTGCKLAANDENFMAPGDENIFEV